MTQQVKLQTRQKRDTQSEFENSLLKKLLSKAEILIAKLKVVKQVSNERHTLSCLNDHQLRDIGLTRDQVKTELGRSTFDIDSRRYYGIDLLQGGLKDSRRTRIKHLPKD